MMPGRRRYERSRAARDLAKLRSSAHSRPGTASAILVRCVLDAVATPIVAVGAGGEITRLNIAAELLLDRVFGAVEARSVTDLVSPRDAVGMRTALADGTNWSGVIAVHDGDGDTVVLDMTLIPFVRHTAEGVAALATFADVTTQITEAAAASMRRIPRRATMDGPPISFDPLEGVGMPPALSRVEESHDASVVIVGSKIAFASTAALNMVGAHSAADVVGMDVFDFVASSSIEATVARQESAKAGIWPRPEMLTIVTIDGVEKQVEVASTPVRWEGQPASQMTMWEPPVGAERVRQLATGVRTDVADAVIIIDAEHRIRSLNHAAEQLYGWKEWEVLGTRIEEVIPWLGGDADLATFLRNLEEDGRWHGLAVHGRRDGGTVHVLVSTTLLTDSLGRPAGLISVNRAATDQFARSVDTPTNPALREEIRRALANDEFTVHYQPIVRLDDGTPVGAEALARWNHPTKGLLLPAAFIQAAEQSGLIGRLGEIVLEKACAQAQRWRDEGLCLYLSVNMSARQLADGCLPTRLADIMTRTDTQPGQLWLEITETALVEDLDQARKALGQIDELGVRVSIDDFGTGWASLTYLREFPVHALKIDRLFVNGLGNQSSDLAIVKSILALGRELGLDVIAEGIETLDQSAVLRELGCETGQGYFFGRPAPPEELLSTWRGDHRLPPPMTSLTSLTSLTSGLGE